MPWTIASDIDGTLTGDDNALQDLGRRLSRARNDGLFLILCTGRRLDQVTSGFVHEHLPTPDAIITQVGTEIYLPPFTDGPMTAWDDLLRQHYDRNTALAMVDDIAGIRLQEELFNTPLKTSFYLDRVEDPEAAAATIIARARSYGDYQAVWSSGRDLDILPALSGKGKAVRFLVEHLERDAQQVAVAGDTGNDIAMFAEFGCGVVVANARDELLAWVGDHPQPRIIVASRPYAAGVSEGLEQLGVLPPES